MIRAGLCALLATFALAGCEGEQRDFSVSSPPLSESAGPGSTGSSAGAQDQGGSARAGEGPPAAGGLVRGNGTLGAACEGGGECASGFCADGVCCQSSCDTVCSRCDTPGQEGECTVAANDPQCGLSCPTSTECRSYGSSALTANCEAVGLCRTLSDCTAADSPAGTACEQGAGTCDGQGECVVPGKKRLGEACQSDAECARTTASSALAAREFAATPIATACARRAAKPGASAAAARRAVSWQRARFARRRRTAPPERAKPRPRETGCAAQRRAPPGG